MANSIADIGNRNRERRSIVCSAGSGAGPHAGEGATVGREGRGDSTTRPGSPDRTRFYGIA